MDGSIKSIEARGKCPQLIDFAVPPKWLVTTERQRESKLCEANINFIPLSNKLKIGSASR